MLVLSPYLSGGRRCLTRTLQLFAIGVFYMSSPCNAFNIECSQQGKYRVCEIIQAVPASPFEVGDGRDRNYSSPSRKLSDGLKKKEATENATIDAGKEGKSRFQATIIGSPSSEQRKAVDFCMERAAENWVSSVDVQVLVKFEDLEMANLLGSAQPSRNWIVRDYICPVALAEAMLGRELNSEKTGELKYDVWMTLNSQARWYTGTDARPPFGRYDLVTVCLHETYHGLFMSGGNIGIAQKDDGSYRGFFYNTRFRGRFDVFMGNQDLCQIIGYKSNETSLGAVLTGNNLWFAERTRRIGRLHAPRPYKIGSSLYHLSEWEYGEGTNDNDLMTPAIGSNYGQHNVGGVVLEMQAVVLNIDEKRGAEECSELRDPQEGDGLIDQGTDTGDDGGTKSERTDNNGGFTIRIGNNVLSGWIVVGAGVGAVLIVGGLVWCVVSASLADKRKAAAARKERRRRRAKERIDFEAGNGGGVV